MHGQESDYNSKHDHAETQPFQNGLDDPPNPLLLLAVAFIQGLAIYWLVDAQEFRYWPAGEPIANTVFWTITLIIPPGLLLGATLNNQKRFLTGVAAFAGLALVVAGWIGFQLWPIAKVHGENVLPLYIVTGLVLCFKALIYLQLWAARQAFTYNNFFRLTWRNLLLTSLGYTFMGVVGLLLLLWGELFKLVNINFFSELFEETWFIIPALTTALGLGIIVFRRLTHIIDTFSRVLRSLCFFLLPLISAIMLMFLAVLPVQGLDTLWGTGSGTFIVLALLGYCLLFFNATYHVDEGFGKYPAWLEKIILVNLTLTPIYALIALYGIWLRIDQYGLTVLRCCVFTISLLMLGLTSAYCYSIIRERLAATPFIGRVNVGFGWAVMALALLVNTPLLDFRQLSLSSQLASWKAGEVSDHDLDISYIARHLGRPGALALEEIQAQGSPELASRIAAIYADWPYTSDEARALGREDLVTWRTDEPLPEGLVKKILTHHKNRPSIGRVHLLPLELNGEAPVEWLALHERDSYPGMLGAGHNRKPMHHDPLDPDLASLEHKMHIDYHDLHIHYLEGDEWEATSVQPPYWDEDDYEDDGRGSKQINWERILREATIEPVPPKWQNISLDGKVLEVHE